MQTADADHVARGAQNVSYDGPGTPGAIERHRASVVQRLLDRGLRPEIISLMLPGFPVDPGGPAVA